MVEALKMSKKKLRFLEFTLDKAMQMVDEGAIKDAKDNYVITIRKTAQYSLKKLVIELTKFTLDSKLFLFGSFYPSNDFRINLKTF